MQVEQILARQLQFYGYYWFTPLRLCPCSLGQIISLSKSVTGIERGICCSKAMHLLNGICIQVTNTFISYMLRLLAHVMYPQLSLNLITDNLEKMRMTHKSRFLSGGVELIMSALVKKPSHHPGLGQGYKSFSPRDHQHELIELIK